MRPWRLAFGLTVNDACIWMRGGGPQAVTVVTSQRRRLNLDPSGKGTVVRAITVRDRVVGAAGLTLSDIPIPIPTRPRTT